MLSLDCLLVHSFECIHAPLYTYLPVHLLACFTCLPVAVCMKQPRIAPFELICSLLQPFAEDVPFFVQNVKEPKSEFQIIRSALLVSVSIFAIGSTLLLLSLLLLPSWLFSSGVVVCWSAAIRNRCRHQTRRTRPVSARPIRLVSSRLGNGIHGCWACRYRPGQTCGWYTNPIEISPSSSSSSLLCSHN